MFEIDPLYVIYLFVALAAGLSAEAVYLLFFNTRSYRKNVNRRLKLLDGQPDRENVLIQLRRERGLNAAGRVAAATSGSIIATAHRWQ